MLVLKLLVGFLHGGTLTDFKRESMKWITITNGRQLVVQKTDHALLQKIVHAKKSYKIAIPESKEKFKTTVLDRLRSNLSIVVKNIKFCGCCKGCFKANNSQEDLVVNNLSHNKDIAIYFLFKRHD